MSGALDGIRVLDLSTLVQGPQAAAMLHGLGAEVIKIELPEIGDMGRHVGVLEELGTSAFWEACNRGKRSGTLDLRTEAGHEAFLKLVGVSDVGLSNFQPGTLDGWVSATTISQPSIPESFGQPAAFWVRQAPTPYGRGPISSAKQQVA